MDLFKSRRKSCSPSTTFRRRPGRVTDTAEGAKAIAQEIGRPVMVKAQVKAGGRGKAGGVKYAATAEDAYTHAKNILGLDIKGHIVKKLLVAEASDIAEEYYISFLLDRANRTYLAMCSVEGGVEIEEVAATKPDRLAKVSVDAVDEGLRPRDRSLDRRAGPPARRGARRRGYHDLQVVGGLRRRGRHPGRGQPAGADPRRPDPGAGRQGDARRQRRLPAARPRRIRGPRRHRPAGVEGQGARPELRQARRSGRTRSATERGPVYVDLDVVAYAGERMAASKPANSLDIGGGVLAEVMANGLDDLVLTPRTS